MAAPVLHVMGCGARSELEAPGGAELGCQETFSAVYSASIGGGIHHLFTECIPRPDGGNCPAAEDAMPEIQPVNCPYVDEVECGPIVKPEQCCYVVQETCGLT